jgi:hypothetical protein
VRVENKNMVHFFYKNLKNIFILLISFLLSTCANQLPPGGGEVDTIPPEIVEYYPQDGTTNYDEDYFEIGFSEYVDKRSAQDAIFISPAIEGEIEYDWSGKSLRVYFPEPLKGKTTYVITVGTDVADYNNKNRMAQAFTFTFSTGSEIDRRVIAGKVYDPKAEDVMIFAYRIDPALRDRMNDTTTNPLSYKPDYISQAGKKGDYKLMGLAAGKYRIFAIEDRFRDLLFQPDQDRIGIPFSEVEFAKEDTLYEGLDFFLSSADTTAPRLINAVMTDELHILLNVSERIDSTIINKDNFHFIDSTSGKVTEPLYAYKGNTKPTEFALVVPEKFPVSDKIFVIADTLRDIEGNLYLKDFTSVTISEIADTTKPKLFKTIPVAGSRNADFLNQEFYFFFDDAFNRETGKNGISFEDTLMRLVKFDVTFLDDATFKIILAQRLEPQKDYIIKIDFSKFRDAAGNYYDSVYQYKFKTINGLDFTGVTGTISNADFSKNPILILEGTGREKKTYKQPLNKTSFSFERVEAGKYFLWCFYDTDSSGTYSYGTANPFLLSEEFYFYQDTLNLKPRWTVTDVKFGLGR